MTTMSVAVIGGGVSGAMSARLLQQAGCTVELFEQASAPGGRAISWRDDSRGLVLDSGAAFFTSFYSRLLKLLPELGLSEQVHQLSRQLDFVDPERTMRFNASSVWSSAWSSLTLPTMGLRDKWRLGLYLARINGQRRHLDWVNPASLRPLDDRNVAEDAIAQVGERAYHAFIRQTIEPFWFMPAEEISRAMFIGMMAHSAGARFYSLPGGIDQISRALLRGQTVHLNAEVHAVSASDAGYTVAWQDRSGLQTKSFNKVVCTTTASVAARLCAALPDSRLSPQRRDFLKQQRYCMNAHVAYLVRRERSHPVSLAVPAGDGQRDIVAIGLCGERYPELMAAGQEIISLYFSPEASARYLNQPEQAVFADAWSRARRFYPSLPEQAEPLHLAVRPEAIPAYGVGQYGRILDFQSQPHQGLVFAGDYLAGACIEGALASAERAVHDLLRAS